MTPEPTVEQKVDALTKAVEAQAAAVGGIPARLTPLETAVRYLQEWCDDLDNRLSILTRRVYKLRNTVFPGKRGRGKKR